MASRYWGGPRHIIGLNAGHGIYVTSRLVNPITGMATAWGSPMVTGLCLIQIERREKSQASFNSRLILTQTVLRADVICITGKKGLCLFSVPVCVCVCVWEGEQKQCCNWKCIVGLYMHMLRDKRSHTDQQTERFYCRTLMRTAVYPQIQIIYVMAFLLSRTQLHLTIVISPHNYTTILPQKLYL